MIESNMLDRCVSSGTLEILVRDGLDGVAFELSSVPLLQRLPTVELSLSRSLGSLSLLSVSSLLLARPSSLPLAGAPNYCTPPPPRLTIGEGGMANCRHPCWGGC